MDIIASIFAYLGCVTGIVGALAVSFFVVFAVPETAAPPHQALAMVSRPVVARTIAAAETKPAPKAAQRDEEIASHGTAPAHPPALALSVRQKTQASRAQARRLVQEERARRWAYEPDSDFESRFLGYAD
jgi:hypothetical protein